MTKKEEAAWIMDEATRLAILDMFARLATADSKRAAWCAGRDAAWEVAERHQEIAVRDEIEALEPPVDL